MISISLKAVRTNTGMTQKEWAEKLGVTDVTVNNWENGKTEPTLSQLRKMSDLSGIPMDFIFASHRRVN